MVEINVTYLLKYFHIVQLLHEHRVFISVLLFCELCENFTQNVATVFCYYTVKVFLQSFLQSYYVCYFNL